MEFVLLRPVERTSQSLTRWASVGRSKAPHINERGRVSVPNGRVGSTDRPTNRTSRSRTGKKRLEIDSMREVSYTEL